MFKRCFASFAQVAVPTRQIKKVLVANRGEIACRVFKTCEAMGIRTVGVYCDSEKNAKHVQHANEAFRVGEPPAATSYLRSDRILEIAKMCGADAIHPGYGFLSENAAFSKQVSAAGIEFIGPPAEAIISMGSKSESKSIMQKANVPVVPGYHGEQQDDAFLAAKADEIGYPLLIKAVSGGGGKGMKIVRAKEEFETLLHSAKREALNFFKDDRVLLEKYIEYPRHIECQIFCDKFGNGVFFFERDCSVQRRYQKVLEEAPAPHLTIEMRNMIGDVAVTAAKAVGYVGAGTVEFIFDTTTQKFYFMEMNTRLQVEHPVTEEVVFVNGKPLDLVRLQIDVASGKPLGLKQEDLECRGHCIEARIFAEAPRAGFLPGSGHLEYVKEPQEGHFGEFKIRLDTGFRSGDDVLVHYDPMIAKLIVWGSTRSIALRAMRRALDDYHIVGVETNIEFLKQVCENEKFMEGGVTTKFIEENKEQLLAEAKVPSIAKALAAFAYYVHGNPKHEGFRLNTLATFQVPFAGADGKTTDEVQVHYLSKGKYLIKGNGFSHIVVRTVPLNSEKLAVHLDDRRFEFQAVIVGHKRINIMLPDTSYVMKLMPVPEHVANITLAEGSTNKALSPMPGKVAKFLVPGGSTVTAGQNVLVLEAMKMEHLIKAPCDGKIRFNVKEGDMVRNEQILAEFEGGSE